jgi:YidC/Oxa1 family membrane protein insertase
MSAVLLSVIFFIGYTAIFPPKKPDALEANATVKAASIDAQAGSQTKVSANDDASLIGHKLSSKDKMAANESSNILTVSNDEFILKMDTLGRIASMELLQEKFNDGDGKHAQIIPDYGVKPLYVRFVDEALNKEAISTPYSASVSEIKLGTEPQKITLTQKLSALTVTKEITFYADGHYDINVNLSQDKRHYIYLGQRPQLTENMMTVHGAMVYTGDDLVTIIEDGEAEGRKTFNDVQLISAFDQYSATIMYGFGKDTNIIVERDRDDNPVVYFDALQNMSFNGYIGQKEFNTLKNIDPMLTNAIEYGWFTFAAKPLFSLLSWLHGIFGNWGWSIIALTILVRIVLYPLTYKGMVSMAKLKEIAPQVKEIQAKYKGDPQRMNAAVMDFYKKKGANPLGGCLPMLLQIPVFFAIYRVLLNAVELQGAEWALWIDDLSRMDGTFILPILMGASMYYQQKITPTNFTDPMQEKVMKFLPIIFTFFFLTFPSGLVLYWFVNNLFSIAQQFIVNQQMANAKDAQIAAHKNKAKKDD